MNKTLKNTVKNLPQETRRKCEDRMRLPGCHGSLKRFNPDKQGADETRQAFPELK